MCVAPVIPGDTCAVAFSVGGLPFSTDGDTSGATDDYAYSSGQCPPETGGWGNNAPDEAYAFDPPTDGNYTITLNAAYDSNLFVVTDCGDVDNSCVGGDEVVGSGNQESLSLDLSAGTTYYILVDGWSGAGAAGGYSLTVDYSQPTCADYCTTVMSSCTGDNAQYADQATCVAYCATWAQLPAGAQTDTSGNTMGCRTYHAGVAGAAPGNDAIHCDHAGPTGGNVCGTWCENYCHLSQTNCTDGNALYADEPACESACGGLNDGGDAGATDGDSLQCRIYHLGVAGSDGATSAATHCPHGAEDGGGVCEGNVGPLPDFVINEIDYDQPGSDTAEFVELYNSGTEPITLAHFEMARINGSNNTEYGTTSLGDAGATLAPGQYLVVGSTSVVSSLPPGVLSITLVGSIQNGAPDGISIVRIADDAVVDSMAYEGTMSSAGEGGSAGTDAGDGSLSRCPNGADTDDNSADFVSADSTPGESNDCGGTTTTTFAAVHDIYVSKCGACHSGPFGSGSHSMGDTDINDAYSDSQKSAYSIMGTKGGATIVRIQSGAMPLGGGCSGDPATDASKPQCLTQQEQDDIQAWIDGGQLAP